MLIGDLNLFFILIIIFALSFIFNNTSSLSLLLTAELIWIFLYSIALIVGFYVDNINILSLTFFFLIFSAVEFSLGLIILFFQYILLRSINSDINQQQNNNFNFFKFNKLFINNFKWNF